MNLYGIKCLMFTEGNNIKIKREIDGEISTYSWCNDCGFKKFETIIEERPKKSLAIWTIYKTMLSYCLKCKKIQIAKTQGL